MDSSIFFLTYNSAKVVEEEAGCHFVWRQVQLLLMLLLLLYDDDVVVS
jgi:hypothetical protein